MPYEVKFESLPLGYSTTNARPGEQCKVRAFEYLSTEDGQQLIDRLEGWPSAILASIPDFGEKSAASISLLLAVIRRDKSATVYVNELDIVGSVQVARNCSKGEKLRKDDIADITEVNFDPHVEIKPNEGILVVFSIGWRRGMFYDLTPLHGEPIVKRTYSPGRMLGQCYADLLFQEMLRITEAEWQQLFAQQWFPFKALGIDLNKELLNQVRAGWMVDDILTRVVERIEERLPAWLLEWKAARPFAEHIEILSHASERFVSKDYMSAAGLLYPRIEGLMRSYHRILRHATNPTQNTLAAVAKSDPKGMRHAASPLLPTKFSEYIKEVYFAAFDPKDEKIELSRHSVSHGVASPAKFSAKGAAIAILIVEQLFRQLAPMIEHEIPAGAIQADQGN